MIEKASVGVPVDEEFNCYNFIRIPESLIEEPDVCEWCEYYENGLCYLKK